MVTPAWTGDRHRPKNHGVARLPVQEAPQGRAERGHLEPGSGARLGALVAARQAAPATELGERVLDPVERPDWDEAADTRWRRLDVEREVLTLGEPRERRAGSRPSCQVPRRRGEPLIAALDGHAVGCYCASNTSRARHRSLFW